MSREEIALQIMLRAMEKLRFSDISELPRVFNTIYEGIRLDSRDSPEEHKEPERVEEKSDPGKKTPRPRSRQQPKRRPSNQTQVWPSNACMVDCRYLLEGKESDEEE